MISFHLAQQVSARTARGALRLCGRAQPSHPCATRSAATAPAPWGGGSGADRAASAPVGCGRGVALQALMAGVTAIEKSSAVSHLLRDRASTTGGPASGAQLGYAS